MDERTGDIRQGIEETRARVGEEVEALSYKTDVGARLDDYVDEKKEAVTSKVKGATDAVVSAAGTVVPSRQRLRTVRNTAEPEPTRAGRRRGCCRLRRGSPPTLDENRGRADRSHGDEAQGHREGNGTGSARPWKGRRPERYRDGQGRRRPAGAGAGSGSHGARTARHRRRVRAVVAAECDAGAGTAVPPRRHPCCPVDTTTTPRYRPAPTSKG